MFYRETSEKRHNGAFAAPPPLSQPRPHTHGVNTHERFTNSRADTTRATPPRARLTARDRPPLTG